MRLVPITLPSFGSDVVETWVNPEQVCEVRKGQDYTLIRLAGRTFISTLESLDEVIEKLTYE